jgi:uncharacterized membrane protein YozB (DUF420 family)
MDVFINGAMLAGGFLPNRGSWMLDFVSAVMLAVIAAMFFSIYQVRVRKNHKLHRKIQIVTALALVVALVLFEVDVRFFTDWREIAAPSPYYDSGVVSWALAIHLAFAIPTPIVWGIVIAMALRRFRDGFSQGDFNRFHRISGRIAAAMMFATAVTGWVFYYLAFVA